jgi:hypothetical protein
MRALLLLTALVVALPLQAGNAPLESVTWAGQLVDSAGPVNRLVPIIFVVRDGATVVDQVEDDAFNVVGGNLIVDLLVTDSDGLELDVIVDGESLGTQTLRTSWPFAVYAERADVADVAERADAVGDVTDPLTLADLATPGTLAIPLASVTGFPAAFLDGDQGLAFTPDAATFTFVDGVLSLKNGSLTASQIASVSAADLATGAVTSAKIADGSITSGDFNETLPLSKIAADTMVAANFGAASTQTVLFKVTEPGCSAPFASVTTSATCRYTNTGACSFQQGNLTLNGNFTCTGECSVLATSDCPNTRLGVLVFK